MGDILCATEAGILSEPPGDIMSLFTEGVFDPGMPALIMASIILENTLIMELNLEPCLVAT